MSKKFTKVFRGLSLPHQSAEPTDKQDGDIYFDGTDLLVCKAGVFAKIVTEAPAPATSSFVYANFAIQPSNPFVPAQVDLIFSNPSDRVAYKAAMALSINKQYTIHATSTVNPPWDSWDRTIVCTAVDGIWHDDVAGANSTGFNITVLSGDISNMASWRNESNGSLTITTP